ncbi:unnamed protein product [Closterium sp. NIES-64]|nr:unnamed protein product [Closterium sp. NIES-64]
MVEPRVGMMLNLAEDQIPPASHPGPAPPAVQSPARAPCAASTAFLSVDPVAATLSAHAPPPFVTCLDAFAATNCWADYRREVSFATFLVLVARLFRIVALWKAHMDSDSPTFPALVAQLVGGQAREGGWLASLLVQILGGAGRGKLEAGLASRWEWGGSMGRLFEAMTEVVGVVGGGITHGARCDDEVEGYYGDGWGHARGGGVYGGVHVGEGEAGFCKLVTYLLLKPFPRGTPASFQVQGRNQHQRAVTATEAGRGATQVQQGGAMEMCKRFLHSRFSGDCHHGDALACSSGCGILEQQSGEGEEGRGEVGLFEGMAGWGQSGGVSCEKCCSGSRATTLPLLLPLVLPPQLPHLLE